MAVINYTIKENTKLGTHSYYVQAKSFSTLSVSDMQVEVSEGLGISPDLIPTIIKRYMRVVVRNVQRGHRVKLGDELVIYPQISCSVKDEVDADGNVTKVATPDMLNLSQAKSTIGATIAQSVQAEFAKNVSWKRVNEKEDDTTTTDPTDGGSTDDDDDPTGADTDGSQQQGGTPVLTIAKSGTGTMTLTDQSGHQVDSGSSVTAGQTLTLSVTPAGSATPTATIGTQTVTLTEDEGQWVGTFQMPATSATLTVRTGGTGDNEE